MDVKDLGDPEKLTGFSAIVAAIFGGYWKWKASRAAKSDQLTRIENLVQGVNADVTQIQDEFKVLRENVADVRERVARVEGKLDP